MATQGVVRIVGAGGPGETAAHRSLQNDERGGTR